MKIFVVFGSSTTFDLLVPEELFMPSEHEVYENK